MNLETKIKNVFARHEGDVQARPGRWSEIERGVARSHKRRLVAAAVAGALAITGGALAIPRVGRNFPVLGSGDGYFIAMPEKASSPTDEGNGGASLSMTTNLPEGTRASYEITMLDPRTQGASGPATVSQKRLDVEVSGDCLLPPEAQSKRFNIKIIVTRAGLPQGGDDELGTNGKDEGNQVRTYNGAHALVAEKEYEWPPDKCGIAMKSLVPDVCGETSTSINDDEGGENLNAVVGSVVVTLTQLRLCELYNYGTEAFKAAEPWPAFRDRTKAWVDAHRPLAKSGFEFLLTGRITRMSSERLGGEFNSPAWIEVDYTLRGERVAHARFVARLWYSGYTKWEIAELDLL